MAIVERGKKTTTPVIIKLPIPATTRQDVEDIGKLRKLLKNQDVRLNKMGVLEQRIKTLNEIIKALNPRIDCPELGKEIDIHWCHSSCEKSLCKPSFECKARIYAVVDFFKLPI